MQNPNAIVGGAATKRSKSEPKMALPKTKMRRMKRQNRSQPIAKMSMKAKPSVGEDEGGAADDGGTATVGSWGAVGTGAGAGGGAGARPP